MRREENLHERDDSGRFVLQDMGSVGNIDPELILLAQNAQLVITHSLTHSLFFFFSKFPPPPFVAVIILMSLAFSVSPSRALPCSNNFASSCISMDAQSHSLVVKRIAVISEPL